MNQLGEVTVLGAGPGWLAIDKPAGLSVHNDPEGKRDALSITHALLERDPELRKQCRWNETLGAPSPAHRLDRETSGILLLALNRDTASILQTAFADRKTTKIYRAVLRGTLPQPIGSWSNPLTDKAEGRRNPAGSGPDRKPCRTDYKTVRTNPYLTQIEVALLTGRQHQIRRHAALASHAIVGDSRYGEPKYNAMIERKLGVSRMMLHAQKLELECSLGRLTFESPLPLEFDRLFEGPT